MMWIFYIGWQQYTGNETEPWIMWTGMAHGKLANEQYRGDAGGSAQLQCIYFLVVYTDLKAAEDN